MNPELQSNKRLLWFCLFAAVVILGSFGTRVFTPWGALTTVSSANAGGDGLQVQRAPGRFFLKVTSVAGPAAHAGIRLGDEIDMRSSQRLVPGSSPHNAFTRVKVIRDGRAINVTIAPEVPTMNWSEKGRVVAEVWTILFAALIAWRGKRWVGAAPLAFILAAGMFGDALVRSVLPYWQMTLLAHVLGGLLNAAITFALLVRYFAQFGTPPGNARIVWTRIAYAACALSALAVVAHFTANVEMWIPADAQNPAFQVFEFFLTLPVLPALVCGILAARDAGAAEGQRIGWVTASFGVLWILWLIAGQIGPLLGESATPIWDALNVAHIVVPLGLTYAALQRRLFDVGFIVNRAAVFTAVSTIVIGSFVLLEWGLGKWFEGASHATSVALNAALALTLGLSMRFLHHRVDGFVDSVFFRKRHDNERALRRFAREVMLLTDRALIPARIKDEILDHSEVSAVDVVMAESLNLNDPAVLAMRTWYEPVELARYRTLLCGEYAFPLAAHGNLIGAIVCGPKRNEEAYAPDEIEALKEVANGVGLALWSLDAAGARNDALDEIRADLRALRATLA